MVSCLLRKDLMERMAAAWIWLMRIRSPEDFGNLVEPGGLQNE